MEWHAIQYVSSGFALCAFIVAAIAGVLKRQIDGRLKSIQSATQKDRADLVRDTLEFFHVDTSALTNEQQYRIVMEQIRARAERFRWIVVVVVILGLSGVGLSAFAISKTSNENRVPPTKLDNAGQPPKDDGAAKKIESKPKPFTHVFRFNQPGFSIAMPNSSRWNHGVSSLGETEEFTGKAITITRLKVSFGADNHKSSVCCDVWVYIGPGPFGFSSVGGGLDSARYPEWDEPTEAKQAPVSAKFVVGSGATSFPIGKDTFSVAYDFQTRTASAYPHLDNLKEKGREPFVVDHKMYAQVFFWNGNQANDLDIGEVTLQIEGLQGDQNQP